MIGIHRCPNYGCSTYLESLGEDFGKLGANACLLEDFDEGVIEISKFHNAG